MALNGCPELNERYQNAPHWIISDMEKDWEEMCAADQCIKLMAAIEQTLSNGCFCPSCLLSALEIEEEDTNDPRGVVG
tara:strand:+ start:656 stop:889 length:234 start_codon:yes stop_codon:yes gene_type:complete